MISGTYYEPPEKWKFDALKCRYLSYGINNSTLDFEIFEKYKGIVKTKNFLQALSECITIDDNAAIDISVDFVISPVYFHYSGYIRQTMARRLKNVKLSKQQTLRIVDGVQALISSGKTGEEFEQIHKLYLKVVENKNI